jgi:hypothetical protein
MNQNTLRGFVERRLSLLRCVVFREQTTDSGPIPLPESFQLLPTDLFVTIGGLYCVLHTKWVATEVVVVVVVVVCSVAEYLGHRPSDS